MLPGAALIGCFGGARLVPSVPLLSKGDRVDHRKRMLRAVRLFGWGGVVLSVAVALVRMLTQDTGQQLAIAAWTAANVVNMVAVTMLAYLLRVRPGLRPH